MDQPIRSRAASKEYRKNWENVFGKHRYMVKFDDPSGRLPPRHFCPKCNKAIEKCEHMLPREDSNG